MADSPLNGRQFVILGHDPDGAGEAMAPVGPRPEILAKLARHNTAPEGNGSGDVLFGPGFCLELTPGQDPITQMLVTINEDEIGWFVLTRIIKQFGWKLLDPDTGRELNLQAES